LGGGGGRNGKYNPEKGESGLRSEDTTRDFYNCLLESAILTTEAKEREAVMLNISKQGAGLTTLSKKGGGVMSLPRDRGQPPSTKDKCGKKKQRFVNLT